MKRITKIDVLSVAYFCSLSSAVVVLITGILYSIFGGFITSMFEDSFFSRTGEAIFSDGLFFTVFGVICGFIGGFVTGALFALIYNLIAKMTGGIKVKLDDIVPKK